MTQFFSDCNKNGYRTTFWYADFKYLNRNYLSIIVDFGDFFKKRIFFSFLRDSAPECKEIKLSYFGLRVHQTKQFQNEVLKLSFVTIGKPAFT